MVALSEGAGAGAPGAGVIAEVLAELEEVSPAALVLARCASLASRIEPALVRSLRLELFPQADVSAEADLWWSELVDLRAADAVRFSPLALEALHRGLAVQPALVEASYRIVRRVHGGASPLARLQEWLSYRGLITPEHAVIADKLGAVVGTIARGGPRRDEAAAWAVSALPRLPAALRRLPAYWSLAFAASRHGRGAVSVDAAEAPPPEAMAAAGGMISELLASAGLVEIEAACDGDTLLVRSAGKPRARGGFQSGAVQSGAFQVSTQDRLAVPDVAPLVVAVRAGDAAPRVISIEAHGWTVVRVPSWPVEIEAIDGRVYEVGPEPPPVEQDYARSAEPSAHRPIQQAQQTAEPSAQRPVLVRQSIDLVLLADSHDAGPGLFGDDAVAALDQVVARGRTDVYGSSYVARLLLMRRWLAQRVDPIVFAWTLPSERSAEDPLPRLRTLAAHAGLDPDGELPAIARRIAAAGGCVLLDATIAARNLDEIVHQWAHAFHDAPGALVISADTPRPGATTAIDAERLPRRPELHASLEAHVADDRALRAHGPEVMLLAAEAAVLAARPPERPSKDIVLVDELARWRRQGLATRRGRAAELGTQLLHAAAGRSDPEAHALRAYGAFAIALEGSLDEGAIAIAEAVAAAGEPPVHEAIRRALLVQLPDDGSHTASIDKGGDSDL